MMKRKRGFSVSFSKQFVFNSSLRRFPRLLPFEHHGQVIQGVHGAGNNSKNSILSASQINQILETMSSSGNVVEYRLCRIDLREVVTTSWVLNISYTKLSTSQLSAIFQAICGAVVEVLELKEENLKYVATHRITSCIASLKTALLDDCSNNNEALSEGTTSPKPSQDSLNEILLEGICSDRMEFLNLGKVQLHAGPTGWYLTCSRLRKVELEQLFTTLTAQNRIRDITIENSDLAGIGEDILATCMSKMRFVELSSTNLTSRQLSALFHLLADSTELEEIILTDNILSHVTADALARSLARLKKVKLEYSYLITEQCMQILTMALDDNNNSLEFLRFGPFGYGSCNLPPELAELVRKAKEFGKFKLEFVKISRGCGSQE